MECKIVMTETRKAYPSGDQCLARKYLQGAYYDKGYYAYTYCKFTKEMAMISRFNWFLGA